MVSLTLQVDPATWVLLPESPAESWAATAANEFQSARLDAAVDTERLVEVLLELCQLPRDPTLTMRLVGLADIGQRYWLLDLRILGRGSAPDVATVRAAFPDVPAKYVEGHLAGGKFHGTLRYAPVYVPDPDLSALRGPGSSSETLVATFVLVFSVPGPGSSERVIEVTLSHAVMAEAVAALPAVDEILRTVSILE